MKTYKQLQTEAENNLKNLDEALTSTQNKTHKFGKYATDIASIATVSLPFWLGYILFRKKPAANSKALENSTKSSRQADSKNKSSSWWPYILQEIAVLTLRNWLK
jgi:hypothetical protein